MGNAGRVAAPARASGSGGACPVKGCYYDADILIDIFSRDVVGARVHARETGPLAQEMMREVFGVHGIPHVRWTGLR